MVTCGRCENFNPKKTENSSSENKKKLLLIKNSTNQNRSLKHKQPIIMFKKKSVDQSKSTKSVYDNEAENESSTEPTQSECSPHKIRKVSQSSAGGMSPDSGWGDSYSSDSSSPEHAYVSSSTGGTPTHSDNNDSSEPSSPVTYDIPQTPMTHHHTYASRQPSTPTQPEIKTDMSNYIEQAFQFSMGMKPEVKTEVPEVKSEPIDQQPIESPEQPTQSSRYDSYSKTSEDVFDIFGDVNVDISHSKTAPPWEELDIEIEPCFKNNISPFYFN